MRLNQNKVAILLSTFNGEKYICEQLDSLLASTVPADIYIRDDGSKDSTREIIAEYTSKHVNIELIPGDNIGVVGSFFSLISYVNDKDYDFYCFCDQDDFWENTKISAAIDKISYDHTCVMYCSTLKVVDENLCFKFKSVFPTKEIGFSNALVENIVTGCTVVLNKNAFSEIKYNLPDPRKIVMHDWWFYLVMSVKGKIIYDSDSFIKYRQHGHNVEGMKTPIKRIVSKFIKGRNNKYPSLTTQLKTFDDLYVQCFSAEQEKKIHLLISVLEKRRHFAFLSLLIRGKIYRNTLSDNMSLLYSFITGRI